MWIDGRIQRAAQLLDIGDLSSLYKASKVEFDASTTFQEAARQEVVLLQHQDPFNTFLWKVSTVSL